MYAENQIENLRSQEPKSRTKATVQKNEFFTNPFETVSSNVALRVQTNELSITQKCSKESARTSHARQ